jgi:hypothetical protein
MSDLLLLHMLGGTNIFSEEITLRMPYVWRKAGSGSTDKFTILLDSSKSFVKSP